MFKSFRPALFSVLALACVASHAASGQVYSEYDYNSASGVSKTIQELTIGAQYTTSVGGAYVQLVGDWWRYTHDGNPAPQHADTASHGPEFGYVSPTLQLGKIGVSGTLGYGRSNHITNSYASVGGDHHYVAASVKGTYAFNDQTGAYADFRYRTGIDTDNGSDSRVALGLTYAFTPQVRGMLGGSLGQGCGEQWHGLVSEVRYTF